jgi:hypothetical protein
MYVTCIYLFLLAMPCLNITHFIKFISSTTNCVSSIEVYLIKKKNLCSRRQSIPCLHKFPHKFSNVWRKCTRKGKCKFLIRLCRRYSCLAQLCSVQEDAWHASHNGTPFPQRGPGLHTCLRGHWDLRNGWKDSHTCNSGFNSCSQVASSKKRKKTASF